MKPHPFAKYSGCGNDFILFDNRADSLPLSPSIIRHLCCRKNGIGADGVILLENPSSNKADYRFRIFNSDSTEAEMCGNGIRCFVKWLSTLGLQKDFYHIETMQEVLKAREAGNDIAVEMPPPRNVQWNILMRLENKFLRVHFLHVGVPHTILFSSHIDDIEVDKIGHAIRHYSLWSPHGTNVNFVERIGEGKLKVRTFERGVEGETLACGTGATAAALAAARTMQMESPIIVQTKGGDELTVSFQYRDQIFSEITLIGPADCELVGKVDF